MSEHDIDFVVDAFSSEPDAVSRSHDPAWIHLSVLFQIMKGLSERHYPLAAASLLAAICGEAM
jgi:hypothetical protein